jgi:hypothetical protein
MEVAKFMQNYVRNPVNLSICKTDDKGNCMNWIVLVQDTIQSLIL